MPELPVHLERLAHDLRGPLAPLQTAAYLLKREDLDPERRRELAAIVERQTARLGRMIDEVGDWIRAGQSRLITHRERTELGLLLDLAAVALTTGSGPPVPPWQLEPGLDQAPIDGDTQRLAQMLGILIGHARHRADGGELRLSGHRLGERVQLRIADSGPPLTETARKALLDTPDPAPFDEGLGLRLLIAQAIARAHGGQLSARPGADRGTEYLVELPLVDGDPASL